MTTGGVVLFGEHGHTLTRVTTGGVVLFGEGRSKHVAPQLLNGRSFVLQTAKLAVASDTVPLPRQQCGALDFALHHLSVKETAQFQQERNHSGGGTQTQISWCFCYLYLNSTLSKGSFVHGSSCGFN